MAVDDHHIDELELVRICEGYADLEAKVERLQSALALLLSAFSDRMHPDVMERIREELRDPPTIEEMG